MRLQQIRLDSFGHASKLLHRLHVLRLPDQELGFCLAQRPESVPDFGYSVVAHGARVDQHNVCSIDRRSWNVSILQQNSE